MKILEYPGFKIINLGYGISLRAITDMEVASYSVDNFEDIEGINEQNWKEKIIEGLEHAVIGNENIIFIECCDDDNDDEIEIDTVITFHPDAIVEVYNEDLISSDPITSDHNYIMSVSYGGEKTFITVMGEPAVIDKHPHVPEAIKLYSEDNIFVQHV